MVDECPLCESPDADAPNPIMLGNLLSPIIKVCDHPWHEDPWGDE